MDDDDDGRWLMACSRLVKQLFIYCLLLANNIIRNVSRRDVDEYNDNNNAEEEL